MCNDCKYCQEADTMGHCEYYGVKVLLDDRCHHEAPRGGEIVRCRICGTVWDAAASNNCYWFEDDLCGECAEKEMTASLSGLSGLMRDSDKERAENGKRKLRRAGNG